jgi:hypothetical protein
VDLNHPFRRDARRALSATPFRKLVSGAPLLLILVAGIVVGGNAPWWVWPTLVLTDLLVFAFIGNAWAQHDAVEMDRRE